MNLWPRKTTLFLAAPIMASGLFLLAGCDEANSRESGGYNYNRNESEAPTQQGNADETPTYVKHESSQQNAQAEKDKTQDEKSGDTKDSSNSKSGGSGNSGRSSDSNDRENWPSMPSGYL